jgi:hypothetical protein
MSITSILNMYRVAITLDYRYPAGARAPIDAGKLVSDNGSCTLVLLRPPYAGLFFRDKPWYPKVNELPRSKLRGIKP